MLDNFKATLISKNYRIESLNLTSKEETILTELLEYGEIENLNIQVSSVRRKGFNCSFVDFVSTNSKTIKENLQSFFSKDYVEDLDLNKLALQELEQLAS